jgi:hypothetical protein
MTRPLRSSCLEPWLLPTFCTSNDVSSSSIVNNLIFVSSKSVRQNVFQSANCCRLNRTGIIDVTLARALEKKKRSTLNSSQYSIKFKLIVFYVLQNLSKSNHLYKQLLHISNLRHVKIKIPYKFAYRKGGIFY